MGNAPQAAHKTTSGFLVPCRIDDVDTNGAKDPFIKSLGRGLVRRDIHSGRTATTGRWRGGKLFIVIVISAIVLVSPPQ